MKNWISAVIGAVTTALCLAVSPAQATPVTWTFQATFSDGETASGSFVYDADNGPFGTYEAINILTSGASGAHYGFATIAAQANFFSAVSDTGQFALLFFLSSAMGNDGGTIDVDTQLEAVEGACSGIDCSSVDPIRTIIDGEISSTPIPGAIPLFTSGLGVLGFLAWRRKRVAAAA